MGARGSNSVDRRSFIAAIITTGMAGCTENISSTFGSSNSGGMTQTFGFGSSGFDRLEWNEDGSATLWFDDDHGMDGFEIAHTYQDIVDDNIVMGAAPDFQGPIELPLVGYIRDSNVEYPNREFVLGAFKGLFMEFDRPRFNIVEERLGTQDFTVPEKLMPGENLRT